jgi:hypothetical protein
MTGRRERHVGINFVMRKHNLECSSSITEMIRSRKVHRRFIKIRYKQFPKFIENFRTLSTNEHSVCIGRYHSLPHSKYFHGYIYCTFDHILNV